MPTAGYHVVAARHNLAWKCHESVVGIMRRKVAEERTLGRGAWTYMVDTTGDVLMYDGKAKEIWVIRCNSQNGCGL
jgi:hypothetical protein